MDSDFGLFSLRSGWLTRPQFTVHRFDDDQALLVDTAMTRCLGLLRGDGTWQVEPRYTYVGQLSDERAVVCMPDATVAQAKQPGRLCGGVDADGKLVVPLRSWFLGGWRNGLGTVLEAQKAVALIDKSGNIIGGRLFDEVKPAASGDIGGVLLDGKWVGLDRQGRIVANPENDEIIARCPSGIKLIQKSGKVQVVGADGQPTVPYLLDYTYNRLDCDKPSSIRLGTNGASSAQ